MDITKFLSLLETYSRAAVIRNAGKKFQQNLEKVKETFPNEAALMLKFEELDKTPQKKLVPIFVQWFKNLNFDTTSIKDFIDLLNEYSDNLAEAIKKNIPITTQTYGIQDPYTINDLSDLTIYMVQVKSDVEELALKKEEETKKQDRLKQALLYKDDDIGAVYKSKDEETNCVLGKGTKWCISGKVNNTTGLYIQLGTKSFYLITTNLKKNVPDLGEIPVKYAYVIQHPYTSIRANANMCFDFRDDANEIPALDAPLAKNIFQKLNKSVGVSELGELMADFTRMVLSDSFFTITIPDALARAHGGRGGGTLPTDEQIMFSQFFYFLMYGFGGGHKNKVWRNMFDKMVADMHMPPDKKEGSDRYIEWDTKYFYPEVFYPAFMSNFVRVLDGKFNNEWSRTKRNNGTNWLITYYVVKNIMENYASENDVRFWEGVKYALNSKLSDIMKLKQSGRFIDCLDEYGEVIFSTSTVGDPYKLLKDIKPLKLIKDIGQAAGKEAMGSIMRGEMPNVSGDEQTKERIKAISKDIGDILQRDEMKDIIKDVGKEAIKDAGKSLVKKTKNVFRRKKKS